MFQHLISRLHVDRNPPTVRAHGGASRATVTAPFRGMDLAIAGVVLPLLGLTVPVLGQATRSISVSAARGDYRVVTVDLHRGHGVTLNFRPTGEQVQRAWLDDPSQVTLDFDDPRCATVSETCAATVIHLRRIHRIDFSSLPATDTTALTVLTEAEVYTFQIAFPHSDAPAYAVLEIQPELSPGVAQTPTHQQIARGLHAAQAQGLVAQDDPLWQRVQIFLELLGQHLPLSEAAAQAGISEALVQRLAEMGRS